MIVHNDPINLMSYVTMVFMRVFGYPRPRAETLMLEVHQQRPVAGVVGRPRAGRALRPPTAQLSIAGHDGEIRVVIDLSVQPLDEKRILISGIPPVLADCSMSCPEILDLRD